MKKSASLEWGTSELHLSVPDRTDILSLPVTVPLADPARAIRNALGNPIGAKPLQDVIADKQALLDRVHAVVVVSDNTRPVPYKGTDGILEPILETLRAADGVTIEILVATGMHRPLAENELREMLCDSAFLPDVTVTNHVAADLGSLRRIGVTGRGTDVWINQRYLDADIKILTGLVEPHVMAGVSGGRKSVCPGLIGQKVTYVFHGPEMMADPMTASLVINGNQGVVSKKTGLGG